MEKRTKVVAHEVTDTGTGIFYKCGYGEGHYSTLLIRYPLPSLLVWAHIALILRPLLSKCGVG